MYGEPSTPCLPHVVGLDAGCELARGARTIDILCVQYMELEVLDQGFGCAARAWPPPLRCIAAEVSLLGALVDDTNKVPADLGLGALN